MDLFQAATETAFWLCVGAVVYAYFGYPLLIWCLSGLFGRRHQYTGMGTQDMPSVSLLIAAHNEEAVIEERLANALALDYPPDKLQIVVASDGSEDGTADIVRRFADRGLVLIDYPHRRGKATA